MGEMTQAEDVAARERYRRQVLILDWHTIAG
jgi:hypothetical protein